VLLVERARDPPATSGVRMPRPPTSGVGVGDADIGDERLYGGVGRE